MISMGLFNKFKKESKKKESIDDSVPEKMIKPPEIKPTNTIKKEQLENELSSLQNELSEKNARLSTIMEKIQLSKNEYDDIVKKLIQSKKELRLDNNQIKTTSKNLASADILKEINNSKIQLQKIQDEIINNKKINDELERKIEKNKPSFSDSENQKKKIDEKLIQRQKELEVLKKKIVEIKKDGLKVKGDGDKGVVEAASQIVATTNKRLQDTMKELDVTRQLLDKERQAHSETKKKLQS